MSSMLKLVRSLGANLTFVMDAAACRHHTTLNLGTRARTHAWLRHFETYHPARLRRPASTTGVATEAAPALPGAGKSAAAAALSPETQQQIRYWRRQEADVVPPLAGQLLAFVIRHVYHDHLLPYQYTASPAAPVGAYVMESSSGALREGAGETFWQLQQISDNASRHNHLPLEPGAAPSFRKDAIQQKKDQIVSAWNSGIRPAQILVQLQSDDDPDVRLITRSDVYNLLRRHRRDELGSQTPIEWLFDRLGDQDRYVFYDLRDDNGRVVNLFIAPRSGIKLLQQYPDVILCESTFKTNRFNMPLFNICGAIGIKRTFQVVAAFLSAEDFKSYSWAVYCFYWTRDLTALKTDYKPLLDAAVIKTKGRPKGALGLAPRTTSRRDPVLFEIIEAIEKDEAKAAAAPATTAPSSTDLTSKTVILNTALGLLLVAESNSYEAGTERQRLSQRALDRLEDKPDDEEVDEAAAPGSSSLAPDLATGIASQTQWSSQEAECEPDVPTQQVLPWSVELLEWLLSISKKSSGGIADDDLAEGKEDLDEVEEELSSDIYYV
ncbi:hypothetical protein V8C42DRAFT_349623 [Trichoderma barbatum]